jgi:tetratricopeptide (TPR) repeat protein
LIALAEIACQKQTVGPPPRYAVLRFENLSGDPSLDWTARAASEMLSISLAGALDGPVLPSAALARLTPALGPRPSAVPGISAERQKALLAGATRLIFGYVERAGSQTLITAVEDDVATGKSLRTETAADPSPLAALDRIARQFSSHPGPAPTSNATALRLYSTALESPISAAADDLDKATRADPNFGTAWVSLVNLELARGDRGAAEDAMDRARRQKLDALSQARLDLEQANLRPDQSARIEALRKVVSLTPGDTGLLRTLAETEMSAGRFEASAADWKRLAAMVPDNPSVWNSIGYTLSYAGDYNGAMSALRQYASMRPKDANPHDSMGDLNFSFRKFKEAAGDYMQANDAQPDFEQYGDLFKAAWAKFNAGDKPGADALFSQFRAAREKLANGLIPLMVADWLYRTGRKREALDSLRATVATTASDTIRANGYAQLTIWELLGHDREQAAKDSLSIGPRLTDAPMLIARFAALPSVPAAEWETRADRLIPASMATLRPMALAYALILDGKREAALPVWKQIVERNPATDFFTRALYASLQGKPQDRPLVPDPANLNLFLALL